MEDRQNYIKRIKKEIVGTITSETIYVKHDEERVKFYKKVNGKQSYISYKESAQLIEISRNMLYKEAVNLIDNELKSISFSFEKAYDKLPEEIKKIAHFQILMNDNYVEKWKNKYHSSMAKPDNTEFFSANGEHVRSKSELIIADMLKRYSVPYHYEPSILLGKQLKCPDFLVLNIKTRKEYIWEHFGKMDNPDYCKSAIEKLSFYEEHGYSSGENLIITMESSLQSLDTQYAEKIIKKYLLNSNC